MTEYFWSLHHSTGKPDHAILFPTSCAYGFKGVTGMTGAGVATLVIQHPSGDEQRVTLRDGQELRIGRDEGNEIVIRDAGVSRVHASISVSSTGVVLSDLNSLNGVFVNGMKLAGLKDLTSRDLINIGPAKLSVKLSSDEMIDSLSSSPASRAMTAQMRPISVSVVVFAINDFTTFTEELPTEDVAEVQLRWMSTVRDAIEQAGGKVDKIIGINVVAVWVGSGQRELAAQAAKAMTAVLEASVQMGEAWKHQQSYPLVTTAALSSGMGLTGALGANSSQSAGGFTILGDPVNSAFALQGLLAEAGTATLVDEISANLLGDVIALQGIGKKQLPGTGERMELYTVP